MATFPFLNYGIPQGWSSWSPHKVIGLFSHQVSLRCSLIFREGSFRLPAISEQTLAMFPRVYLSPRSILRETVVKIVPIHMIAQKKQSCLAASCVATRCLFGSIIRILCFNNCPEQCMLLLPASVCKPSIQSKAH